MQKLTAVLILLAATAFSGYAENEPDLTRTGFRMNGMQHLGDHGFIAISESKDKATCTLTLFDNDLKEKWSVPLAYKASKKKSEPLDVQILADEQHIYWISKSNVIRTATLNATTGAIELPETLIEGSEKLNLRMAEFIAKDGALYVIDNEEGTLKVYGTANEKLSDTPKPLLSPAFQAPRLFACVLDGLICSYGYQVDRNHSKMQINMTLHDVDGNEIRNKTVHLESKAFSFAYNSFYDQSLLTFSKLDSSLLVFGKLDYQFDKGYVDNPEEAAFTGFWAAKINTDLSGFLFNEFPFIALEQVVPNGTISRYVIIDLKEDENHDLYFNFTVQPVVFDPLTYIFHLSSNLDLVHANKGKIGLSFFDYNKYGVRNFARSNNITLRTDIWRYHSVVFLPMITNRTDEYSRPVQAIKQLNESRATVHPQDKIYSFYTFDKSVYILEYTTEAEGTLRIYKARK